MASWDQADVVKPIIFIVGVPKAGTTSVYDFLANQSFVAKGLVKEPNFLNQEMHGKWQKIIWKLNFRLFGFFDSHVGKVSEVSDYLYVLGCDDKSAHYAIDGSVGYCLSDSAIASISQMCGAKVILCTRDPSARSASHVKMLQNLGVYSHKLSNSEVLERDAQVDVRDFAHCHMLKEFDDISSIRERLNSAGLRYLELDIYQQTEEEIRDGLSGLLGHKIVGQMPISNKALSFRQGTVLHVLLYRLNLRFLLRRIVPPSVKRMVKDALLK